MANNMNQYNSNGNIVQTVRSYGDNTYYNYDNTQYNNDNYNYNSDSNSNSKNDDGNVNSNSRYSHYLPNEHIYDSYENQYSNERALAKARYTKNANANKNDYKAKLHAKYNNNNNNKSDEYSILTKPTNNNTYSKTKYSNTYDRYDESTSLRD